MSIVNEFNHVKNNKDIIQCIASTIFLNLDDLSLKMPLTYTINMINNDKHVKNFNSKS